MDSDAEEEGPASLEIGASTFRVRPTTAADNIIVGHSLQIIVGSAPMTKNLNSKALCTQAQLEIHRERLCESFHS